MSWVALKSIKHRGCLLESLWIWSNIYQVGRGFYFGGKIKQCLNVKCPVTFLLEWSSFICSLSTVWYPSLPLFCVLLQSLECNSRRRKPMNNLDALHIFLSGCVYVFNQGYFKSICWTVCFSEHGSSLEKKKHVPRSSYFVVGLKWGKLQFLNLAS